MSQPDTSALDAAVARMDRESARLLARSEEVYDALARASATVSDQQVELTVAPNGTLSRIAFRTSPTSHTTLSTAVRTLYRQAAAVANQAVAEAVPEVGDGVREAGAQAIGDDGSEQPARRGQEPTLDAAADAWQPTRSATGQGPALTALDRLVEQVESAQDLGALRSAFAAPEVAPTMPGGDPALWQRDLERQVAAIGTAGAAVTEQLGQLRSQSDSGTVEITVGATGALLGVSFHLAARGAETASLAQEFMQTYALACQQAAAEVTELLSGLDEASDEALGAGTRPPSEEV